MNHDYENHYDSNISGVVEAVDWRICDVFCVVYRRKSFRQLFPRIRSYRHAFFESDRLYLPFL